MAHRTSGCSDSRRRSLGNSTSRRRDSIGVEGVPPVGRSHAHQGPKRMTARVWTTGTARMWSHRGRQDADRRGRRGADHRDGRRERQRGFLDLLARPPGPAQLLEDRRGPSRWPASSAGPRSTGPWPLRWRGAARYSVPLPHLFPHPAHGAAFQRERVAIHRIAIADGAAERSIGLRSTGSKSRLPMSPASSLHVKSDDRSRRHARSVDCHS
jgi:hypothetical protein